MNKTQLMLLSLDGLSVGDAFGERFFVQDPLSLIHSRQLPDGEWKWTDDTHMALSIVEMLGESGQIEQDSLIKRFSSRYMRDHRQGYGSGTRQLMQRVYDGEDWRVISKQIFPGGSFGNGAAMRSAPIGGYFANDPERAAQEARLSAEVTHAHPEGIAGAVAVAVAASIAAKNSPPTGYGFLKSVIQFVPEGLTRSGIQRSLEIAPDRKIGEVARSLGNGREVSAQDTVPFCLWCAAHHLDSYEEALWTTVTGLGDRDTTCAIVGGIVALAVGNVPVEWLERRERLAI